MGMFKPEASATLWIMKLSIGEFVIGVDAKDVMQHERK